MPCLKKKYTQQSAVVTVSAATDKPEYLDVKQAAVHLSSTVTSARRWLQKQKLRCVKIGKRFTYKRSDIDTAWRQAA